MPQRGRTCDVERISDALDAIVRWSRVAFYERIMTLSGVEIDRSAIGILNRLHFAGPQRLSDLARYLRLDPSTVSRQVKAVVDAGFVTKTQAPEGVRARLLELTDQGRGTLLQVRGTWSKVVDELLADFDGQQLAGLAEYLPALGRSIERSMDNMESTMA